MNMTSRAEQTESNEVLYELDEGIAVITLNAPERMNTISGPMLNDLTRLLIRANEDPAVRCVILTGNGRAFCAGLDLRKERSGDGPPGPPVLARQKAGVEGCVVRHQRPAAQRVADLVGDCGERRSGGQVGLADVVDVLGPVSAVLGSGAPGEGVGQGAESIGMDNRQLDHPIEGVVEPGGLGVDDGEEDGAPPAAGRASQPDDREGGCCEGGCCDGRFRPRRSALLWLCRFAWCGLGGWSVGAV